MVIDSSAVVAIVLNEPEAAALERKIVEAESRLMSAGTLLELMIVIEAKLGHQGAVLLDEWLEAAGVDVIGFDDGQARTAREAWRRFGKGRHQASLNFGDCFSYALASLRDEPLLFKGHDFTLTDLKPA